MVSFSVGFKHDFVQLINMFIEFKNDSLVSVSLLNKSFALSLCFTDHFLKECLSLMHIFCIRNLLLPQMINFSLCLLLTSLFVLDFVVIRQNSSEHRHMVFLQPFLVLGALLIYGISELRRNEGFVYSAFP